MKRLIEYLKVLADPTRMKIIKFLLERDMYVCELVAVMGLAQPTISQAPQKIEGRRAGRGE